jgi:hypothetical protein
VTTLEILGLWKKQPFSIVHYKVTDLSRIAIHGGEPMLQLSFFMKLLNLVLSIRDSEEA